MSEWFVAVNGQSQGPYDEAQLVAEWKARRVGQDTLVYGPGVAEWTPIGHIPTLQHLLTTQADVHTPAPRAAAAPAAAAAAAATSAASGQGVGHTLEEFLAQTAEKDNPGDVFELESSHMLEIHVNGRVWSKLGAMVAYRGQLKFVREGAFEHGLGHFMKKALTGEAAPLTKIEGQGICYLADEKKTVTILRLDGRESLCVNGNDLLAFEDGVTHEITMHRKIAGMLSGGLFSVRLSGHGMVAIVSHGRPLTLRCSAADPVTTDPNATVAWSGSLTPEFKTDISFRSFIGRGGGEAFQMRFAGDGFVVVQPYEEKPVVAGQS